MNEQKILRIKKRTGEYVGFDLKKISNAIFKAAQAVGGSDYKISERLAEQVFDMLNEQDLKEDIPSVEDVQDCVEKVLIETGHAKTAKAFILYRQKRAEARLKADALVGIKGLEEKQDPFGVNEELFGSSLTSHNIKVTVTEPIAKMFTYNSKLSKLVDKNKINAYRKLFYMLKDMQKEGSLPLHPANDYLAGNELAMDIYRKKYYVHDLDDNLIEQRPEDVFVRLGSYLASIEEDEDNQVYFAQEFYKMLYEGYFVPGGRVIAGAGDLYRLKTLANCFVSVMEDDNIESIYKAAFECARTYSYGGGIGVDISTLRPREAVVHNAANFSTGSVSFMEIYSLTTGLIGQAGRRGALMLTIDVKHPDILNFIRVKQESNWVTKQIREQCSWSGKFNAEQLDAIEKQVRENTQVRFANISMKVTDEFMTAVEEQNKYGKDKIVVYKKFSKLIINRVNQSKEMNFAFGIPSKYLENYELYKVFETIEEANEFIHKETNKQISKQLLENVQNRDIYGDVIVPVESQNYDLAVRYSGDYLLYFSSEPAGETRRLVKARDIWDEFVKGNYQTAEPGLIFWSRMTKYSPSNYIGRPIASTNPCIAGNSQVSTSKGLQQIKELVGKTPQILTDNRVPIQVRDTNGRIMLLEQKQQGVSFDTIEAAWSSGIKETYKLTTKKGYEITATGDHKIMTTEGFKQLHELTPKDKILIQKGEGMGNNDKLLSIERDEIIKGDNNHIYHYKFPTTWSKELGQLLGWTVGDGFITPEPDNRLGLVFSKEDEDVMSQLKKFIEEIYGKETKPSIRESTTQLRYHSKYFCDFLRRLGIKSVKAELKQVPHRIFTAPKEAVVGFLQGLFTADGTMAVGEKGNYIRLTSKSEKLLKEIQIILINLGMLSTIYERHRTPQKKFNYYNAAGEYKEYITDGKLWELSITKGSLQRFVEEIGFIGSKHQERIKVFLTKKQYQEHFYDTIKSIEPQGKQEVFDLTEPRTHSFIANGIVISNCGEVPLEDGGACNLGSINLSRLVIDGFTDTARINWNELERVTKLATRFLDNVVGWNISLNALDKQRSAAAETRRLGLGVMGIADMLFQLGLEYDSEEGIAVIEKVCQVIANAGYRESAELAEEKGASPVFDYNKYSRNPFFKEALDDNTKELVKKKGLRNIAILSIAPTGTISNIVLGYKGEQKNYIGVSGGVEPVFAIFYTRRSENFGNKRFNIFHSTVSAYLDKKGLQEKAQYATSEDELRQLLPGCFFRTAHYIEPEKRVLIQGDCQKYTDHSISSTVNLPESISPETISEIYIKAWKFGLKGITIYRDGSRYPILSIQQQQSAFQDFKKKQFKYVSDGKEIIVRGDQVIKLPQGKLSTPYHAQRENIQGIVLTEITDQPAITEEDSSNKNEDHKDDNKAKVCTISFEDGKLVKSCSE
ncbi:hypothetical protein HYY69_02425 [Candidatus Woesearchaeota archaeon]|nr:hypothetical protein [Candidatus Woesearchaeota archaeon]